MEKKEIFKKLLELAASERKVAVATVVRAYGSTPREVGAKMVVLENGEFLGTIGGGCGEAEAWQEARRVLSQETPATVHIDLTEDPNAGGEKICGGKMDVFIDLWRQDDLWGVTPIVDLLEQGKGLSLATVIAAPASAAAKPGTRLFVGDNGWSQGSLGDASVEQTLRQEMPSFIATRRSCIASVDMNATHTLTVPAPRHVNECAVEIFVEVVEQPPLLVVVGAGHCALPLSHIGKTLGFEVVILDDRPECATRERFPDASRILLGDLEAQVEQVRLGPDTYVVLVTRGHKQDEQILRRIVTEPLGYIGMIGSQRRIRAVFADMERDGFQKTDLDKVFSPIGLDIGAETPEEIAISILAEIVRVRKGGTGASMSLRKIR